MTHVPIVKEFMTHEVISLRPGDNIFAAMEVLIRNRISGAPVLDEHHHVVGIVSEKDCMFLFTESMYEHLPGGLVEEVMTREVLTVRDTLDLFALLDVFFANTFRRLPVVDARGVCIGVVSRPDALRAAMQLHREFAGLGKPWTDSRYLTEEIKGALTDHARS